MTLDYGSAISPYEVVAPHSWFSCVALRNGQVKLLIFERDCLISGQARPRFPSTGDTPFQFVTRTRMERAKELLRKTRLPISVIAERVGYQQAGHFTTRFRFVENQFVSLVSACALTFATLCS